MDEKFLLAKADAVIAAEAVKADFEAADVGRIREEAVKAINERRVRRFEDLRNFVHGKFDAIAKEKGLQH